MNLKENYREGVKQKSPMVLNVLTGLNYHNSIN